MGKFFGKCILERMIGKILSILGSSLFEGCSIDRVVIGDILYGNLHIYGEGDPTDNAFELINWFKLGPT